MASTPLDSSKQNYNQPGALRQVESLEVRDVSGIRVTSAHLIFTSRDSRRCAVYAAIATPPGEGPHPLIIHAPGGGQTVAEKDLAFWVGRGFACAAFDWQVGLFDHDPKRKSVWPAGVVIQSEPFMKWSQFILPLAVEAVGVVIDWAGTFPSVKSEQVGMTGISWGGYLTWVANTYEPRLKCAAPVYGCGGLFEKNRPGGPPQVSDGVAERWRADWDPLSLPGRQLSPVCWISATNDFFGFPKDADSILDGMELPHRRSHASNLNHTVVPEDAATVVAWMRHYLAGGPALPEEPQWTRSGLKVDRPEEVEMMEEWWTPSTGRPDDWCWWPGTAPDEARAKFARVRYRNGIGLSTRVERIEMNGSPATLGDVWPDARAGLGCSSVRDGTQLYGNSVRLESSPGDVGRARLTVANGDGLVCFGLRHFCDPRFNRQGCGGLRMRFSPAQAIPANLDIVIQARANPAGDDLTEVRGSVVAGDGGVVELSRETLPWFPLNTAWSSVRTILIYGEFHFPLEVGPFERIGE